MDPDVVASLLKWLGEHLNVLHGAELLAFLAYLVAMLRIARMKEKAAKVPVPVEGNYGKSKPRR